MVVDADSYSDGYPSWIGHRGIRQGSVPGSAGADALQRILACGVDPDDLTDVKAKAAVELLLQQVQQDPDQAPNVQSPDE